MATSKIPRFSSRKNPTPQQLKEFRSYVSQLNKKGILPKGTSARVARPSFVRGGKTLAEIVNANASKLKPYSPPVPRVAKLPLGKRISIRSLNFPHKRKTLAGLIKDLDENYQAIDGLKNPNERFSFQIGGTDSLHVFRDIRLITDYLMESGGIQQVLHKRQASQDIYQSIKIVRWNKSDTDWAKQRKIRPSKKRKKK